MKITFEPVSQEVAVKENIVLNGRIIGVATPCTLSTSDIKFQVQLHFNHQIYPCGFGITKEEALSKAIESANKYAAEFQAEVAALMGEL